MLITWQLELLQDEFCALLGEQRVEDLTLMYKLCERVDGGLDELMNTLEAHIEKQLMSSLEKEMEQRTDDPNIYEQTMWEVYNRYSKVVNDSFPSDSGLEQALDKGVTEFINKFTSIYSLN